MTFPRESQEKLDLYVFLRSSKEPPAPISDITAERMKAPAKVPVMSLIHPARAGPRDWPMPKMRVMNPRAAGASLPPTESPTAAAMIAGMEERLIPKMIEET